MQSVLRQEKIFRENMFSAKIISLTFNFSVMEPLYSLTKNNHCGKVQALAKSKGTNQMISPEIKHKTTYLRTNGTVLKV